MLGDSLNTTVTVAYTLQSNAVDFSALSLTYLMLVGIGAQAIGKAYYSGFGASLNPLANVVCRYLQLLVRPTALSPQREDHVQCRCGCNHTTGRLGKCEFVPPRETF